MNPIHLQVRHGTDWSSESCLISVCKWVMLRTEFSILTACIKTSMAVNIIVPLAPSEKHGRCLSLSVCLPWVLTSGIKEFLFLFFEGQPFFSFSVSDFISVLRRCACIVSAHFLRRKPAWCWAWWPYCPAMLPFPWGSWGSWRGSSTWNDFTDGDVTCI